MKNIIIIWVNRPIYFFFSYFYKTIPIREKVSIVTFLSSNVGNIQSGLVSETTLYRNARRIAESPRKEGISLALCSRKEVGAAGGMRHGDWLRERERERPRARRGEGSPTIDKENRDYTSSSPRRGESLERGLENA